MKNLFICTKPMQWFNIENIEKSEKDENYLIVVGTFPNSEDFTSKVIEYGETRWKSVILCKNRREAIIRGIKLQVDAAYVDYDEGYVGLGYSLICRDIYLYDEGIGTYFVKDFSGLKQRFKLKLFSFFGIGDYPGNMRKTKGLYIYNKQYYKSIHPDNNKKLIEFRRSYNDHLISNFNLLKNVFQVPVSFSEIKDKSILIYATSHELNDEIILFLNAEKSNYDEIWIKLHPHLALKEHSIASLLDGFKVVKELVMIEVLITILTAQNKVTIVHESSTACLYFNETPSLSFINFGGKFKDSFNEFKNFYN